MIYLLAAAAFAAADLLIKSYVNRHRGELEGRTLAGGRLRLRVLYNRGFAGNRMEERAELVKGVTAVSVALYLAVFVMFLRSRGEHLLKFCLAAAAGGAVGNTLERLLRGKVTDYLQPVRKGRPWKRVFNFADLCIVLGSAAGIAAILRELFLSVRGS